MCGIAGLLVITESAADADPAATAGAMAATLAHRGPDGSETWADPAAGIGLAHRRLAIIDLTPTGAQPMHSANGRYVITYNGEVYNFRELRAELEHHGHRFRGTSDTEVMLAACTEWGPEAAVAKFVGMFAFALFDRQERTLRLVRDRIGVKPLYWTVADGVLLFGSELRALMAHAAFARNVDPDALDAVVRLSYVPAPATVFKNVFKLPAGSILTARAGREPRIEPYWRLLDHVAPSPVKDAAEAVDALDGLLRDAVARRMIADVPLGAFLSGGTDSSVVVAQMQAVSNRPVKTYTIGSTNSAYDESGPARATARHLGTDHTEVVLEPEAALEIVGGIAGYFDEPFADSSQLPTYLVAKLTRAHVTVALSGDGGDELFAGYPKYATLARAWRYAGALPRDLRAALARFLGAVPEDLLRRGAIFIDPGRAERIGEKRRRLASALSAPTLEDAAAAVATVGFCEHGLVARANGAPGASGFARTSLEALAATGLDATARMQLLDMLTYLPDDILTKVDRCTMAVSLEAREPLLDHRLIEFIWSLPPAIQRGNGSSKYLLRSVLRRYVPDAMIDRPKRGFSVPIGAWLRGPLRDWAEDLLAPAALGWADAARVRSYWQRHVSGIEDNATGLWNILMIQAWARRWLA
jgi:asparagine synthase (glutamine-hydrolysing)